MSVCVSVCVCCIESAGKESLGEQQHTLTRRHYLLEGHAFEVLSKAFREDGMRHSSLHTIRSVCVCVCVSMCMHMHACVCGTLCRGEYRQHPSRKPCGSTEQDDGSITNIHTLTP